MVSVARSDVGEGYPKLVRWAVTPWAKTAFVTQFDLYHFLDTNHITLNYKSAPDY
jgi:hypothetical protein